jgi:multiple antibiotic resistance protein
MPLEQTIGYSFLALVVIVDPVGTAALFVGLTRGMTEAQSRRMAIRAIVIAGVTLLFFAFAGDQLLKALGIGLPAFRIAGGILLFILAIEMVFAHHSGLRDLTESESEEAVASHDISVFPLAIPLIAGPGALTTMVLLMGAAGSNWTAKLSIIAVMVAVLALTLLLLLIAGQVMKVLGTTGVNVVSRVFGILLAALAAQLALDGLRDAFGLSFAS